MITVVHLLELKFWNFCNELHENMWLDSMVKQCNIDNIGFHILYM